MKKKIIIIISLLTAVLLAVFLFLLFTQPLFASKVFELCKVIDLRKNLPKGHFQKVSIVSVTPISGGKDYEHLHFEVPADKMREFEVGFRKYIQSAIPLNGDLGCIPVRALRIQADKGKYFAYIEYNDKDILIYGGFFHRSFRSKELRKVFQDAGLKYDNEEQPAQEKEANQPSQKHYE
jgi:hypothetical protein